MDREGVVPRQSIGESVDRLLARCEKARPHPDWAQFRALPYDDLLPLLKWVQRPFRKEPPVRPLRGLWFGLFNPCPNGRAPVSDIYVCGSERFDPDPTNNNWAVGPDWWPESRYAESTVLAEIYRIAYRQKSRPAERKAALGIDAEYPLCLGYAVFAVRELLEQIKPSLILGKSPALGVAVGFDNGDFVLLGEVTMQGVSPPDPSYVSKKKSIEPIIEDLRSNDRKRIHLALIELPRLGNLARMAATELARIANTSDHVATRQGALYALVSAAPDDPRAKATAIAALEHESPYMRRQALEALISIKDLSTQELTHIMSMGNDPDKHVARWSEIALRNIRSRRKKAKKSGE